MKNLHATFTALADSTRRAILMCPRQLVYDCHTKPELMCRWLIEPKDPNATFESRTFVSKGNGTLMIHTCKYALSDVCKFMSESGAIEGMTTCYEVLDKVLS
jgi:hypothetical protein